ncbi:translocation/assembly module TamB [Vibrio sp. 404]|uniref:Translocation/assembly module TamB n=1 Tax=Vibrio marinisediminis TaxID=2758441 RepID=A0A7W2IVK4_9VIBR|nr:translocation/assembly module TamB domain-containing protein [Vibrio marinisediminis]MBA5764544.1 translocation/assembly module TamB [Vibrio marinisediminis]
MTKVVLKWSKWLSLALLGLVLTLLLALTLLLFTKPGLGLVVWGAERFVPQLTIGDHQGAVFPRFTLQEVTFNDEQLHVDTSIQSLSLAIKPACLTEPSVCVDELVIEGMTFSLPKLPKLPESQAAEEQTTTSNAAITSPLPIRVGRVLLKDIDLNILGNEIQWETFGTGLLFQGNRLSINKTVLNGATVKLAASSEEAPEARDNKEEESQPIVLPEVVLPLSIDLSRLDIGNFKLDQTEPILVHHLGLSALASGSNIKVSALELDMPQIKGDLKGEVTLAQGYPLDLSLNATLGVDPIDGQHVSVQASGSVAQLKLKATLDKLVKAEIEAKLEPLDPNIPFNVLLRSGKAQWPLKGKADYQAEVKRFSGNGSLKGYQITLDGKAKGEQIPDVALQLTGKGDLSQIKLSDLDIETLGGSVKGNAMANWQAPINWAADLSMANIQPGLQWQQAEGNISGKLSTTGSLTKQGGWQVSVPMLDIDGILRQYPLNIVGAVDVSDKKGKGIFSLQTPKLVLSHGPNSLEAKGKLEQQWDMAIGLNLPEMGKSVPELKGSAIGSVKLSGKLAEPKVAMNLSVNNIDWQNELQVASVQLAADVVPLPAPHGEANIVVKGVSYQGTQIDAITLDATGTEQAHEVTLDVDSNVVSTSLALSGSLTSKPELNWSGQLQRMMLRSEQGVWKLDEATSLGFDMATQLASVGAHCWRQNNSSLCLDKDIKVGSSGEAQLSINQFSLVQIGMFLPDKTDLTGLVNGSVWAKWAPNTAPELKASITMPKGSVTQFLEQPLVFGWDSVKLNTTIANNTLKADWLFDVTNNGDVSGELTIPDILAQDKQIDGRLALGTFNLDFLNVLVGEYSQLKSNIETDLKISGPLLHPRVNGQFVVDDIMLHGDISPIEVDSGRLSIDFSGYDAVLSAALQTPDGKLNVAGDANWQELTDWRAKARVFAQELKVVMPPMVRVKVVPDMTITASPKFARIDGSIALPWGRIVIDELPPSAIGVSKDQVIVDAQGKPVKTDSVVPFNIETNISISIGDNFKLSAFGLEGELIGKLNVVQKNKGPFVTGEVNILDGSYRSFGQDLLISEGKILMNGPVDQPYVQITAIRNPENTQDDVTAGVKVIGPADEPQLTIFSDPAMPQANALSYLLRGQDIDGESGGNAMTTTLIGLSLAKSGKVVGELGEAFGVQDLQLDTAGSGDESQVTVSGYVLPGLQVKYGVGIFDSVGEFTVRYRLMKNLYLEAVSGLDSAVDLLYQFQFD